MNKINSKKKANKALGFIKNLILKLDEGLCSFKASLVIIAISSLVLNIAIESALRKNFLLGLGLIFTSPVNFFFNTLIIFSVYSLMYLFKRRLFVYEVVSLLFITIMSVNACMMFYRTTPFNSSDLRMLKSGLSLIPLYLNPWQIILVAILPILLLSLFVLTFIKCKKKALAFNKGVVITLVCAITLTVCAFAYGHFKIGNEKFSNLPTKFKEHGFNTCFILSIIDQGIKKPADYSPERIEHATGKQYSQPVSANPKKEVTKDKPNIIFLQLESFYDVNKIQGYTYSQNPTPIVSALKENHPHGLLRVPSIGAGTANTEFEVLTGMEVAFFGIAEYPYYTVLQNKTCESLAYNTKQNGYTAHAIHNHTGTFYDRDKVFVNLGFDTFSSLENMPNIQRNSGTWAKDSMLTSQIKLALESTPDSADFIYTISVQAHGKYPTSWDEYHERLMGQIPDVNVAGNVDNPENPGFAYYLNELHDCDTFVGSVINEITSHGEPTVLVLFGDHMPAFNVHNWTVTDGDYYTTDYVIYTLNCDADFSDAPKELTSYQLGSYILGKLGIKDGVINQLHQKYIGRAYDDEEYAKNRELLEYDLLYGDQVSLENGQKIYAPSEITYGLTSIYVTGLSSIDGTLYIKGENFNEYSRATINGKLYDTDFLDTNTLVVKYQPNISDKISVVQTSQNQVILGQSKNSMLFTESMLQSPVVQ